MWSPKCQAHSWHLKYLKVQWDSAVSSGRNVLPLGIRTLPTKPRIVRQAVQFSKWIPGSDQVRLSHQFTTKVLTFTLLHCWQLCIFHLSLDRGSSVLAIMQMIKFQNLLTAPGGIPWEANSEIQISVKEVYSRVLSELIPMGRLAIFSK